MPPLGGGGVVVVPFDTVTVTEAEGLWFPAASRATAVSVWVPFEVPVVFQLVKYGADRSSRPRLAPSSLNCTPATPTLSLAVAETDTPLPDTVAPPAGLVSETDGADVSPVVVPPPLVVPPDPKVILRNGRRLALLFSALPK